MKPLFVPAAAYVRMSNDDQQYSIPNQLLAIERYAERRGFTIVRIYADPGKSGLVLQYRNSLKELLRDVVNGDAPFRAILVYDVTRWGRFLDIDESAHYEFLCKQANVPVHYCAELFENNNSLYAAMFKTMKRTMAADYSRELSVKVSAGLKRISGLGFRTTGTPGYGLRRMLVSREGQKKQVLKSGEWKSIATDRVILIPGPKNEVQHVREIFDMYANQGMSISEILRDLMTRRVPFPIRSKKWHHWYLSQMLRNPKYVGANVWGRTTRPLMSRPSKTPRTSWVVKENAFEAIVDRATFDKVQRILRRRRAKNYWYSEDKMLWKLKHILRTEGTLNKDLIDRAPGPTTGTYVSRFGSLMRCYQLAGFDVPEFRLKRSLLLRRARNLRKELLNRIKGVLKDRVELFRCEGALRMQLVIDGKIPVAVLVCRGVRTPLGYRRWVIDVHEKEMKMISLLCLCDEHARPERMYLLPRIEKPKTVKTEFRISATDPQLMSGIRLKNLDDLYPELVILSHRRSRSIYPEKDADGTVRAMYDRTMLRHLKCRF